MRLKTFVVSMVETNAYVVIDESTLNAIVIDPGDNGDEIYDFIKKENIKLNAIVLTHGHFDHIGAVNTIKKYIDVPVIACAGEEIVLENEMYNLSGMHGKGYTVKADIILNENEEYKFGNLKFKTILTPGHTPGGGCFYFENEAVLFSGDTLFYQSIGRTDFNFGSMEAILNSVKKLMKLPDGVTVYSGHGPKTTIGFERKYNPYVS